MTFFVALGMIGLLTVIVGDLATIFGCLIGLKAEVTAITFVALGTSLPDLFASKCAAVGEKHADAAVGNVTGSNSVNVFLGLGTPWLIACIYHTVKVTFWVFALVSGGHVSQQEQKQILRKNRTQSPLYFLGTPTWPWPHSQGFYSRKGVKSPGNRVACRPRYLRQQSLVSILLSRTAGSAFL